MKRISSILVVTVLLITVALTMLYGHSRTQNANRQVRTTNTPPARSDNTAEGTRTPRKGKVLVKRLPDGAEGVELKEGVVRVKPDFKFVKGDKGTVTVARMSGGLGVGGTWSCACGSEGGGTCKAVITGEGKLSCSAGTCNDCSLDVVVDKLRTTIMRY